MVLLCYHLLHVSSIMPVTLFGNVTMCRRYFELNSVQSRRPISWRLLKSLVHPTRMRLCLSMLVRSWTCASVVRSPDFRQNTFRFDVFYCLVIHISKYCRKTSNINVKTSRVICFDINAAMWRETLQVLCLHITFDLKWLSNVECCWMIL